MSGHILSKSTFIRGLQCHKSLYLNKFRPYLRDRLSEEQLAKFARGHAVGKLAHQLFPGGTEMPRPGKASADKTSLLISEGHPVIYEACFHSGEVLIALDILVKQESGWNAYEVKSSLALSETYYNDAALQYFVMKQSGLKPEKFFLVHREEEADPDAWKDGNARFIFTDVTEHCESRVEHIRESIREMAGVLTLERSPDIAPGYQCMHPYPCDFRGVCWKKISPEKQNELLNS
jgi:hypothetical protein